MSLKKDSYLMENIEEIIRLEVKTDPEIVRKQAFWCGMKPGLRVLDVGCGSGKVTSILHDIIQPAGRIVGVDYSKERIYYARERYGQKPGIDFHIHDLRASLVDMGMFDLIWVRFFLEYYRVESFDIVKNLTGCLKPGGHLCLIDLDHNCLNHYELPTKMEDILFQVMRVLESEYNFDPYLGRKLYAYLYDLGYQDIEVDITSHHLIYGKIKEKDLFNWIKKVEVACMKTRGLFETYPGGHAAFFNDFKKFFLDLRRFTYTPLVLCKGMKPLLS